MNDKIVLLINSIRRDMAAIESIYDELERHPLQAETDDDTLIVTSYHLHNLYNAFENIFQNIVAVFENSVDDIAQWHTQLLERMRLDLMPLRPAIIDDDAYDALDELRRFRHLFRHAYTVSQVRAGQEQSVDPQGDLCRSAKPDCRFSARADVSSGAALSPLRPYACWNTATAWITLKVWHE